MYTDPIADYLTRIRNGIMAGHDAVVIPASRMKERISVILKQEGYIHGYKSVEHDGRNYIIVNLKYVKNGEPVIHGIKRVSSPGLRIYAGVEEIPQVHGGLGIAVPYGPFTFKANYLNARNNHSTGANVSNVNAVGVGADWKWHADHTATLAYYDNKDRLNPQDHTRNIVISDDFALRKDTTLYVQAAYVDADSAATIKTSIVAAGIPSVGHKATLLNAGINFTF